MKRKTLLVILTMILCIHVLGAVEALSESSGFEGGFAYYVSNGEAGITLCTTSLKGDVVIPNTIAGYPVTSIHSMAFYECHNITSIMIPDGVTSIGEYAFAECRSLKSVKIPNSVTSIGEYAFGCCDYLQSITIPKGVKIIEEGTFCCSGLRNITLPNTITSIKKEAFYDCLLNTVYYNGTEMEYENIEIEKDNEPLHNAAKEFFLNVTIIGESGKEISTTVYRENELVDISNIEEKQGYVIHLFKDEEYNFEFDLATPISENLILYLRYMEPQYCARFVDYDGRVIFETLNFRGDVITSPEKPTRENTPQYSYAFVGWDGYNEGIIQEERDMIFTAIYNATLNRYTYDFIDYDGKVISTVHAFYGDAIVLPQNPTRINTEKYSYAFAGWDGYIDGMTVCGDQKFTAVYNETLNRYIYKFLDDDGSILKEQECDYGTEIIPPEKPVDKEPYTFDYWAGYTTGMILTGEVTFNAQYKYKEYDIYVFGQNIKISIIYNEIFHISPQEKEDSTFYGYFTEENGGGTKITDEEGNSIESYGFLTDITVFPYFKHNFVNEIRVSGKDCAHIGEKGIGQKFSFSTDKEVKHLICTVKFPNSLTLKNISSDTFEIENVSVTEGAYTNLYLTCIYNGNIPKNETINPFELVFDVSEKAVEGDSLIIEILDDAILADDKGNTYTFENIGNAKIKIIPQLVESITIIGEEDIEASSSYTVSVFPEKATNREVEWSVSDESIATVSKDGVLTPVSNGEVTLIATAKDGSGVFAEKVVKVKTLSRVTNISSDIGVWEKDYSLDSNDYVIYVPESTSVIRFTALHEGTLKGIGKTFINNVPIPVPLTSDETVLILEYACDGYANNSYTIIVKKIKGTKTKVSENGKIFMVSPIGIDSGKTVALALFNDAKFVGMHYEIYDGSVMEFETKTEYTTAKVMVLDDLQGLKPMCNFEQIK